MTWPPPPPPPPPPPGPFPPPTGVPQPGPPHCYAHPERVAGSVCRRCGRPICPDCMREAPVGWQCPSCVREGSRVSPTIRWRPSRGGGLGTTRVTPVVIAIIVVNVAVYVYSSHHLAFVEKYWVAPVEVYYGHRWYQLITSAFLHENVTHLLFNMFTLAIVGSPVEVALGRVRFTALYLLSALGGAVAFDILAPAREAGLGASGAIFGLMGAYYVIARFNRWETSTITGLLIVNVVYTFVQSAVAWQDHLGGIVTGAVVALGMLVGSRRAGTSEVARMVQAAAVVVAVAIVLALLTQIPPGHVQT